MSDDGGNWDEDDWENDDFEARLEGLKMEPIVDKQVEEDAKKSKEETALAAKRYKEREALKEKQAISKRRIEELKLLEENMTEQDRIEMARLLEDEAAMEMAADLFDDDGSKVAKSSSAVGGQNLKSATLEELVQEFCSRMDAFDDFGKCAEILASGIVAGKPKENNLGHFLKTMLRSSAFILAPHRVDEVSVVLETIKAEAKAKKEKSNVAKVAPKANNSKAKKEKNKALAKKNEDFGQASSVDRYDEYSMDYEDKYDFM